MRGEGRPASYLALGLGAIGGGALYVFGLCIDDRFRTFGQRRHRLSDEVRLNGGGSP